MVASQRSARPAIVECRPEIVDWGQEEDWTGKKDMARESSDAGFEIVRTETFLNEDNIYIARVRSGA